MRTATFRVINPKTAELIKTYELQYDKARELNELFHEARKVWAEYHVEAETDLFTLSQSHTYRDETIIANAEEERMKKMMYS